MGTDLSRDADSVAGMFNRISRRYDLLNRLLSLRQDVKWRKKVASRISNMREAALLDLATGTADQLLAFADAGVRLDPGIGIDMSEGMLEVGEAKIAQRYPGGRLKVAKGDATAIPYGNDCFDIVSISFGIRNVDDVGRALREMLRVLKPGGRALILEFSLPRNRFMRWAYLVYFRRILPWVGGVISGDSGAYKYLNRTVETFPYGDDFCGIMRAEGFTSVTAEVLTLGVATIYEGQRG